MTGLVTDSEEIEDSEDVCALNDPHKLRSPQKPQGQR